MAFQIPRLILPKDDVHHVLSNVRRRAAIECLKTTYGPISIDELAEAVAREEADESPAPADVRNRVYISLHQTHLPSLQKMGIVNYDHDRREVSLLDDARGVTVYMEILTRWGITWAEYYRLLGVLALASILASMLEVPVLSAVDPILLTSAFLGLFAVSTAYNLWLQRWALLRFFRR